MASTTETLNIVIREDGSRVVVRSIGDVAGASDKAKTSLDLLNKVLALVGTYLAVDKVMQYADAWGNATGLIAIATKTQAEAAAVTDQLFAAAQRTRSEFNDVVSVYSAAARAASMLGASQADTIRFTEGLGEALAVQHVSAENARGALLQLGQLLDSGKVRAQEFNSVLMGTPVILQTVAKGMGDSTGSVSRLRAMMLQGKLTSQEFFQAFLKGMPSLQDDFDKSAKTFAQSFTIIGNGFERYIGKLNESLGLSNKFYVAANLIAANMTMIGNAAVKLAETLGAALVTLGAFNVAIGAVKLAGLISGQIAYSAAVAAGTVVELGSAEADRQRALSLLKVAAAAEAATVAQSASNVAIAESAALATAAQVANTTATQVALTVAREGAAAKLVLANTEAIAAKATLDSLAVTKAASIAAHEGATLAGAQSFAIRTLREAEQSLATVWVQEAAANATLLASEESRVVSLTELATLGQQQVRINTEAAAAATANAAAQTALNEAQSAAALANAAAASSTAKVAVTAAVAANAAAGTTSLFGQALSFIGRAATAAFAPVLRLFVLINTNPFVALATAIVATIGFLVVWGNDINAGVDRITTLSDVVRAFGQLAAETFAPLGHLISDGFSSAVDFVGAALGGIGNAIFGAVGGWLSGFKGFFSGIDSGFLGVLEGVARVVDAIAGLITGLVLGIVRAFTGLPAVVTAIFKNMFNSIAGLVETAINKMIDAINVARTAIGASLLDAVKITKLDVDRTVFSNYGKNIASSIEEGFDIQGGFAEKMVDGIVKRAQELAATRKFAENLTADWNQFGKPDLTTKPPPGAAPPVDEKAITRTTNALRTLLNQIDPVNGAELDLAKATLTLQNAQNMGLITIKQQGDYLQKLSIYYKDQLDPIGKLNQDIADQTRLLGFNVDQREIESQVLGAQQTLKSQGIVLNEAETQTLREKFIAYQKLNQVVQQQDALLGASVDKRKTFENQLTAIQKLQSNPASKFTKGDAAEATMGAASSAGIDLSGSQKAVDAQLNQFKNMYTQIQQMRDADAISDADAHSAKLKVATQQYELQTKNASTFFGDLASLSSSGNKKLFEVGKAAAIAQAAIQGGTAVMNALATSPWYVGVALAVAAAVRVANQIAQIKAQQFTPGYMAGGYTGDGSPASIAGVVHGQEYVMDAAATARLGIANLEALRTGNARLASTSGAGSSGGGGGGGSAGKPVNVSLHNYGTSKQFEVQQLSESEIRIIARDESQQQIAQQTPKLVASQVNDPNSVISKSINRNTKAGRQR